MAAYFLDSPGILWTLFATEPRLIQGLNKFYIPNIHLHQAQYLQ